MNVAAEYGFVEMVRCLVKDFGADVNHAQVNGQTSVYVSASKGFLAVVICLVEELGARFDGHTPLMGAVLHVSTAFTS